MPFRQLQPLVVPDAAPPLLRRAPAEGPPVHAVAVAAPAHELRREVLVRAHAVLGARRRPGAGRSPA